MAKEYISAATALKLMKETGLGMTLITLHNHLRKHPELGFQLAGHGGQWLINKPEFEAFIHYNPTAKNRKTFISVDAAFAIMQKLNLPIAYLTLIGWIKKYNDKHPEAPMGIQFEKRGNWYLYKKVFKEFINGKNRTNH